MFKIDFNYKLYTFITFAKIKLLIEMTIKPTGIILCGGQSKRMGQNKALLKLGEILLVEHVILALKPVCGEIIISTNNCDLDFLPYRKIKDKLTGIGPIAGFHSSLSESNTEENLIISCDTPFITSQFLNTLISKSNGFDIVLPVYNNRIQTMIGFFKKRVLAQIKRNIENGNYVPVNIFENSNINLLQVNIDNFADAGQIFYNINSLEDYEKAKEIFKTSKNN